MVQAKSVTVTLVYTYNADGLRVAQDVDGDISTFVWDWAMGVPEMLNDGDNLYLVGYDTLGWWDGGNWTFVLPDALGSVRQQANITGTVTDAREWTPFGVEVGDRQTGLGYTGEWQAYYIDMELVYLRARWYRVSEGRFSSPDTIIPDFQNPSSIHRYMYSENNAVNLTDPSGLTPHLQYPDNPYDLTSWLYRELVFNSNSHYVQRIRDLALGGHFNPGKAVIDKTRALAAFYFLVRDRAKWDFKHEIKVVLQGEKVALSTGEALHWFEYSVPGNVHYGFAGRAAGFADFELYAGAGYAEVKDPAHVREGKACCPEFCQYPTETGPGYEVCIQLGCYYFNPDWMKSFFDDPQDQASVEFGIRMYDTYGKKLTMEQFQEHLTLHGNELTPAPLVYGPGMPTADWPYHVGYFNGPDDAVNERWVWLLLQELR